MSCLPKPVLRGHIKRRGIKGIIGALTFGTVNGGLYHYFVGVRRKEAMAEFFRTYDPEAHFKDLVKYGYISMDEIKECLGIN